LPEGVISKTVSSLHRLNVGNLTFDDDGLDGITQLDFQNFRGLDAEKLILISFEIHKVGKEKVNTSIAKHLGRKCTSIVGDT